MKKLFSPLAIVILLINACTDGSKTEVATTTTTAETNKTNSNTVNRAIENGDVSKLDSVIDVNFVDHMEGREVKGLDSAKKMLGDIHNHFANLKMETISNATDGDYNFGLIRMTGTATDGIMGFAANTPVDMMSVEVIKLNTAGKAIEHWSFVEPADMMKMMAGQHGGMMNGKMDDKMMNKKMDDMLEKKMEGKMMDKKMDTMPK
ncbi:MAG: nuclear transport factor 2 family protein [Ferruginibacter sp.]